MSEYLKRDEVRRAALHYAGDALIAKLDELRPVEVTDWIPVTERLPEDYEAVLVYFKWKTFPGGDVDQDCYNSSLGRWGTTRNITHWMPLPQPPEVKV